MKNTGKTFEKAVEDIFKLMYHDFPGRTTIEQDVKLPSPDGPRQFDVVIKIRIPDGELTTVIEGRDYATKLNVTYIDGFNSKMTDVNANKGIMVSKLGFTKGAILKAKRLGIELYALNDAKSFDEFKLEVPVLIEEVSPVDIELLFKIEIDELKKASDMAYFDENITINQTDIFKLINKSWDNGTLIVKIAEDYQEVHLPKIDSPYFLKYFKNQVSNETGVLEIKDVALRIKLMFNYYQCDVREILYSKAIKNVHQDTIRFFVESNSLKESLKNLKSISKAEADQFEGLKYRIKIKNNASLKFSGFDAIEPKI